MLLTYTLCNTSILSFSCSEGVVVDDWDDTDISVEGPAITDLFVETEGAAEVVELLTNDTVLLLLCFAVSTCDVFGVDAVLLLPTLSIGGFILASVDFVLDIPDVLTGVDDSTLFARPPVIEGAVARL
jgi:hypothetical protein